MSNKRLGRDPLEWIGQQTEQPKQEVVNTKDELLENPIELMDFSAPLYQLLKKKGFHKYGDLLQDMGKIAGLGDVKKAELDEGIEKIKKTVAAIEPVARKSAAGRPPTLKREITKSSQEGLKENWTRYTVILREDLLEQLKDYAWTDRRSMKEVVNEMVEGYLKDKEIMEREDK